MSTYIEIPVAGGGSANWKDPVSSFASLPSSGNSLGDARVTTDSFILYLWNGSAWIEDTATDVNAIRRDGTAAPTSAISWNNQNLTGVNNLTATSATSQIIVGNGSSDGNPTRPQFADSRNTASGLYFDGTGTGANFSINSIRVAKFTNGQSILGAESSGNSVYLNGSNGASMVMTPVASSNRIAMYSPGAASEITMYCNGTYVLDLNPNSAGVNGKLSVLGPAIIGNSSPVASAALEVDSTTQGFLPPRMTSAQMQAISSPAVGLVVFATNIAPNGKLCVYTSGGALTGWETITSA
jgi:hypothetical protein